MSQLEDGLARVGMFEADVAVVVVSVIALFMLVISIPLSINAMSVAVGTVLVESPSSTTGTFNFTYKNVSYASPFGITPGAWTNGQTAYITLSSSTAGEITSLSPTNPWVVVAAIWVVSLLAVGAVWIQRYFEKRFKLVAALSGGRAVANVL